jgi:hypothetical protein
MTIDIALQKETLAPDRAETIKTLLKGGSKDEHPGKVK